MANETKLTDEQRQEFINYIAEAIERAVNLTEYKELTGIDICGDAVRWVSDHGQKYIEEAVQDAGGKANLAEYIQNGFTGGTYDIFESGVMAAAEDYENIGDGVTPQNAAYDLTESQLGFSETKLGDGIFTDAQDRWLPDFEGQGDFNAFFARDVRVRVIDAYQEVGEDLRANGESSIYYASRKDAFRIANVWVDQHIALIQADVDRYLEQKKQEVQQ